MTDEPPYSEEQQRRFWQQVDDGDPSDCWEWQGGTDGRGYGAFGNRNDPNSHKAHRIAYHLSETDPGDDWVLHTCDNPLCVNPNHLYLGDHSDNMRDAHQRGDKTSEGESNPNSTLTESDVREIRSRSDELNAELADEFETTHQNIYDIINHNTWTDLE